MRVPGRLQAPAGCDCSRAQLRYCFSRPFEVQIRIKQGGWHHSHNLRRFVVTEYQQHLTGVPHDRRIERSDALDGLVRQVHVLFQRNTVPLLLADPLDGDRL